MDNKLKIVLNEIIENKYPIKNYHFSFDDTRLQIKATATDIPPTIKSIIIESLIQDVAYDISYREADGVFILYLSKAIIKRIFTEISLLNQTNCELEELFCSDKNDKMLYKLLQDIKNSSYNFKYNFKIKELNQILTISKSSRIPPALITLIIYELFHYQGKIKYNKDSGAFDINIGSTFRQKIANELAFIKNV